MWNNFAEFGIPSNACGANAPRHRLRSPWDSNPVPTDVQTCNHLNRLSTLPQLSWCFWGPAHNQTAEEAVFSLGRGKRGETDFCNLGFGDLLAGFFVIDGLWVFEFVPGISSDSANGGGQTNSALRPRILV